jgi:hypothetical protein
MCILSFFRRTKLCYANDKTIDDFTRVVEQTAVLTEKQRIDEIAEIISKDENPGAVELDRLGRLLNADGIK